jgi:hypothetical protein
VHQAPEGLRSLARGGAEAMGREGGSGTHDPSHFGSCPGNLSARTPAAPLQTEMPTVMVAV